MEKLLKSRYKIGEKIAEKLLSVTYRGLYLATGEPVIIKIYRRGGLSSPLIRHLQLTVGRLNQLTHPHIAHLIDGDYGWQGFYFVREYVPGANAAEYLRDRKRVSPEAIAKFGIEAGEALAHAHAVGIRHGNLTPGNVFLVDGDRVKVTDFDLDHTVREAAEDFSQIVFERAADLAPELIRGESLRPAADLYGLGVLLYFMLTGRHPFTAQKGLTAALAQLREDPPPPSTFNAETPPYLEEIILKALIKDPGQRFSSAGELIESLKNRAIVSSTLDLKIPSLIQQPTVDSARSSAAAPDESPKNRRVMLDIGRAEKPAGGKLLRVLGTALTLALLTIFGYIIFQFVLFR